MIEDRQEPDRKRSSCPVRMTVDDFRDWKKKLDSMMDEQAQNRHEFQALVAEAIDRVRLENRDVAKDHQEVARTVARHKIILDGVDDESGLIRMVRLQAVQIQELQNWKVQAKAFLAGICAVASLAGGGVALLLEYIFKK